MGWQAQEWLVDLALGAGATAGAGVGAHAAAAVLRPGEDGRRSTPPPRFVAPGPGAPS